MARWLDRSRIFTNRLIQQTQNSIVNRAQAPVQFARGILGVHIRFYGKLVTLVLCMFFLADGIAILIERKIPSPPQTGTFAFREDEENAKTPINRDLSPIISRNLFSSKGLIPCTGPECGPCTGPECPPPADFGAPVKSNLPFNLIGTLILKDEIKSLATIEDKTNSTVYPIRVNEEIPSKARITEILAKRVVFINMMENRKEFIELPEDLIKSPKLSAKAGPSVGSGIDHVSPSLVQIARTEIDKVMADLNNVITQARAVPHFKNGVPSGFKLFQIVPGSIYDKLGLKDNDAVVSFDGEPLNDPAKALSKLSGLKDMNRLEVTIERDNKQFTRVYEFR